MARSILEAIFQVQEEKQIKKTPIILEIRQNYEEFI